MNAIKTIKEEMFNTISNSITPALLLHKKAEEEIKSFMNIVGKYANIINEGLLWAVSENDNKYVLLLSDFEGYKDTTAYMVANTISNLYTPKGYKVNIKSVLGIYEITISL